MDEHLRQLERVAGESVQDEAALLMVRVRAGTLERDRLELAAYCGHEAAFVACGGVERALPLYTFVGTNQAMLTGFMRGLVTGWGVRMAVRAAAELAQWTADERPLETPEERHVVARMLTATWNWLSDRDRDSFPTDLLDDVAMELAVGSREGIGPINPFGALAYAIAAYERGVLKQVERWAIHCVDVIVKPYVIGVDPDLSAATFAMTRGEGAVGCRQALDVMKDRLVRWALDRRSP